MKIVCIFCGHKLDLEETYDDFSGLVKCYICRNLLEIKTQKGQLKGIQAPQVETRRVVNN